MSRAARFLPIAALALVLSACASGPEPTRTPTVDPGESTAPSPSPSDDDAALEAARDCLIGTWLEDMGNTLVQWQTGSDAIPAIPVTELSGQNLLVVDSLSMQYAVEYTSRISGLGDGTMSGVSEVSGTVTMDYFAESPTQLSIGPVTEQTVSGVTKVFAGETLASESPLAWDSGIDGPAVWWCEGDALSIQPAVSGWILLFERASSPRG